ncbi:MAG TPA: glutamine--tRNA ligase/YqeY domain fusion protein [Myxococcales bacterium]
MSATPRHSNFLTEIIEADLAAGRNDRQVVTRFPPEPNGFLHIGHAKSIVLNFGLARQYGGRAHLRFDDTNPTTEEPEYVEAIQKDLRWLGYDWGPYLHYASDYFEEMYACAQRLIREGKAYVDDQSIDAIRESRGSFERPGSDSPFRNRGVAENLDLFRRMREGEFADGACVLRAKIDMAHPNLLMRDPLLYRIRHAPHHRTGSRWCIYPMYDFAHPLEDAFEGVTHSFCTLEFESNRELYDWVLDHLGPWKPRPHQYEFARLALGYTVMSKRKLLQLVTEKRVSGWDEPRMPTIAGMRRRGVTPEAIREFAELIGVAKNNSVVDIGKLEFAIRNDLEKRARKAMVVLDPLKITITNWPKGRIEELEIPWWPEEPEKAGSRSVPFGGTLYIEREDFSVDPPKGWKRLAPKTQVRLMGAFLITCDEVVRGPAGDIIELRCRYDAKSKGGKATGSQRVAGTLHWVEATRSLPAEVRLYERLFTVEQPDAEGDFLSYLNPKSLVVAKNARVEPALAHPPAEERFQFLRQGYFIEDPVDSAPGALVFNRVIGLRSTWEAKLAARKQPNEKRVGRKTKEASRAISPRKGRGSARAEVRATTPALAERFKRYINELHLPEEHADLIAGDLPLATFFDAAIEVHPRADSVAKWLVNDLLGLLKSKSIDTLPFKGDEFGRLVALVDNGRITQLSARTLLAHMVEHGGSPEALVGELGLEKLDDQAAISAAVGRVLESHAAEVARYRAGEKKLLGVLIGAAMRETQGVADAASVRKMLNDRLG